MTSQEFFSNHYSDHFLMVNKSLISILENTNALFVISVALERYRQLLKEGYEEEFFDFSNVEIGNKTHLSNYQISKGISELKEKGMISIKMSGFPKRRKIRVSTDKIYHEMIASQANKELSQEEFYNRINEAISSGDHRNVRLIRDNISEELIGFMFTWSIVYKSKSGQSWKWNSFQYVKISNFFKVFHNRIKGEFDHKRILQYFTKSGDKEFSLDSYIRYDRLNPDYSDKWTLEEFHQDFKPQGEIKSHVQR